MKFMALPHKISRSVQVDNKMAVNSDVQLANSFIASRLAPKSKDQYNRKVKTFEGWMKRKHPECNDAGDEVDYNKIGSETMKEFVGYISRKRDKNLVTAENPDGNVEPVKHQSYEHVSGYKSAIKNAFRDKKLAMTNEVDNMFKDVFDGYKRTIGDLKQTGEMSIVEGKQALNFSGYRFSANVAITQRTDLDVAIFAHLFLLLCWNLIARCCSVSSIMYDHISWDNDSMVIVFATHKGDKLAEDCSPKHVFANPSNPEI